MQMGEQMEPPQVSEELGGLSSFFFFSRRRKERVAHNQCGSKKEERGKRKRIKVSGTSASCFFGTKKSAIRSEGLETRNKNEC